MLEDGPGEKGRRIRRTATRYMVLSEVLALRQISTAVYKRFPTYGHLLNAGILCGACFTNIMQQRRITQRRRIRASRSSTGNRVPALLGAYTVDYEHDGHGQGRGNDKVGDSIAHAAQGCLIVKADST